MAKLILVYMLLLSSQQAFASCGDLIGSCEYYQCLQQEMNCSEDNYLIKFGHHYCTEFQQKQTLFTAQGQDWLDQIRSCLQEKLEAQLQTLTCENIQSLAVQTHLECYQQHNYCGLSSYNKFLIGKTVYTELTKPAFRNLARQLNHCPKN